MKRVLGLFFVSLFLFSLVSAAGFNVFTGKIVREVGEEISGMSEESLVAYYEENKDLVSNLSEEDIVKLYEENKEKIPEEAEGFLEENSDFLGDGLLDSFSGLPTDLSDLDESAVNLVLNFLSCSLIKNIFDSEEIEIEIPEDVPIKNEVVVLFIDETFLTTVRVEDKKVSELQCMEPDESRFRIFVTSDLIVEVLMNGGEMDDPIAFVKENLESGDLKIEAKGLFNKIKLFIVKIGLNFL